ncbi:murein biosynthesis integral membrane protein MurJ [Candidatus Roizmanbacteria bacterium RIFCSPLOWO2_02_FULL_43_10]|uniref:Lipid II flippase n=2 Tax=Candidatus Roizmaniibacteriota TaxID=1752723 RepID=A0A1F7K1B0_9BACT|nr:MAG: murein biosynthesis integral membrane protein MurJ [Candidatus Roizmanbacteria bacterium RIFCSPHIGHO2_02_FULL_43_11]OGK61650.1 MAG: murein biosynthesis integral membrane protein MurJ [Candidatus Roizmanbacteria bacterium RIFCSPLOWO2_02_FULL_43_10]
MHDIINHTKTLIFRKQKDILSSVIILSSMMVLSRFLGLVRNRTFATFFSKEELDLLIAAYRLPDFVFEVLVTGALSSAFIPIFIQYKKNPKELSVKISSIVNLLTLMLFVFMLLSFIFADVIIRIITPGFTPSQIKEVTYIARIYLISQMPFFVFGNILSGIAQANRIFMLTALAPLIYTIGVIGGTVFLSHSFWLYGPVIGTVAGAFLFFFIQLPILHITHFHYSPFVFERKVLREFFTLFLPRTFSVLTSQIEQTIDLSLATLVGAGSVTVVNFAQRLQLFPVAFVGMAFGQASLPYISSLYKDHNIDAIRKLFVDSILQLVYLSVPLGIFFIFARTPIVRIAYGGRMFDWEATVLTASTLSYFGLSIPFHSIFYFVTRAFYAAHDTKTPLYINLFSIFVNVLLSVLFIIFLHMPVWSLGISFSFAITLNVILQLAAYYRKVEGFHLTKLIHHSIKIYLAGFLAALPSYTALKVFDELLIDTSRSINVFLLLLCVFIIYGIGYLFFSWLFNIEEVYILGKLLRKIKILRRQVEEPVTQAS